MRAKLVGSGVDLGEFRGEITDFPLHLDIPSTDLPVEQCPELQTASTREIFVSRRSRVLQEFC
jgi:hypothetical protein